MGASPGEGEGTRRDIYGSVERQSGRRPPELDGPECPPEVSYLWGWYLKISMGRPAGFSSISPLPSMEIWAWCQNRRIQLAPWELEAIERLDQAFRNDRLRKSDTPPGYVEEEEDEG